jgi:hypothetical protein
MKIGKSALTKFVDGASVKVKKIIVLSAKKVFIFLLLVGYNKSRFFRITKIFDN